MRAPFVALAALLIPAAAQAQELRDYCPERPGIDTPACIVDRGHVSVETGVVDWTLDRASGDRTDTLLIGDTMVRVGVSDRVEARVGWTPFGHERVREDGAVRRFDQIGDVSLGIKASLTHPDGEGLSIAALPFVTLPVGGGRIGAGRVGGGFLLPVSYDLSDSLQLDATPEVDAAANEDGPGRHVQYSMAGGLAYKLTDTLTLTGEGQVLRDEDPDERSTQALAALSLAWAAAENLQFDVFGVAGLNRAAPDIELAAGISRRF